MSNEKATCKLTKKSFENLKFDHNYHGSEKHTGSDHEEYIRHEIDVYTEIGDYWLVLQSGSIEQDYNQPSVELEPSEEGGCDSIFSDLYFMDESQFKEKKEAAKEFCEEYGIEMETAHECYLALKKVVGALDQDRFAPDEEDLVFND